MRNGHLGSVQVVPGTKAVCSYANTPSTPYRCTKAATRDRLGSAHKPTSMKLWLNRRPKAMARFANGVDVVNPLGRLPSR